jgi:hypothetical protein
MILSFCSVIDGDNIFAGYYILLIDNFQLDQETFNCLIIEVLYNVLNDHDIPMHLITFINTGLNKLYSKVWISEYLLHFLLRMN